MKIYTKTGDAGMSGLYSGDRVSKADDVFACLGDIDELNATLGVVSSYSCPKTVCQQLSLVQAWLIDAGACIATPAKDAAARKVQRTRFDASNSGTLEGWIDVLDSQLPKLTRFILPSGGVCAAHLHLARTVCRRAERSLVRLGREEELANVRVFVNRLSDYLFMAARAVATEPEVEYRRSA